MIKLSSDFTKDAKKLWRIPWWNVSSQWTGYTHRLVYHHYLWTKKRALTLDSPRIIYLLYCRWHAKNLQKPTKKTPYLIYLQIGEFSLKELSKTTDQNSLRGEFFVRKIALIFNKIGTQPPQPPNRLQVSPVRKTPWDALTSGLKVFG